MALAFCHHLGVYVSAFVCKETSRRDASAASRPSKFNLNPTWVLRNTPLRPEITRLESCPFPHAYLLTRDTLSGDCSMDRSLKPGVEGENHINLNPGTPPLRG